MRILITGVAGFIGSHLADRLLTEGHHIWGVDNLVTGRRTNIPRQVAWFNGDITDRKHFYEIANDCKPDLVIHCAASYSDPNLWHRDTDTNVAGTINAVLAAKHHGARLVYFQTALPPISSYAISKIAGEQYITLSGVPALIFRLSNIYGPRNVSGPIPTFYKRLSEKQACTVTDTKRDMVYISDLVELVARGINRDAEGKYDVCSGTHRPIKELYYEVAWDMGVNVVPIEIPAPPDDVKQMQLGPAAAFNDFDWWPQVPLNIGIRDAIAWYRENGVTETHTHLALKG